MVGIDLANSIAQNLVSDICRSTAGVVSEAFRFDAAQTVSDITATNAQTSTSRSYRDANGNWQTAAASLVRIHKSEDRNVMTMLVEPAVTNLMTCQKYNVTATTNLTKGGDAASVLSVVNDATTAALIAASELQDLVTNGALFCLDNTLGLTEAYVDFGGATGSTSPCSLSVFLACAASGDHGRFGLYDSVGVAENGTQTTLNGAALVRIRQDGTTPAAATDNMRITVGAGKKVYFVVPQLEVFRHCTSPVLKEGTGSISRSRDDISAPLTSNLNTNGGFAIKVYQRLTVNVDEGYFCFVDNGNGSVNSVGIRTISSRPMLEAQFNESSSDKAVDDISGIIPARENWASIFWGPDEAKSVAPNLRYNTFSRTGFSVSLGKMWFGKYREFGGHACVEIDQLVLFSGGTITLNDVAQYMIPDDAVFVTHTGQSNMRGFGRDNTSGSTRNDGERQLIAELTALYPSNTPFVIDMSVPGTSLDDDPSGPSWMKINGGSFQDGEYLEAALVSVAAAASRGRCLGHVWNQGENDQGGPSVSEWKERLKYILDRLIATVDAPAFLMPPSNRLTSSDAGYGTWREAFRQLEEENDYIYHLPETVWVTMDPASNNLHIANTGYVEYAPYEANAVASVDGKTIAGGVFGPKIHYIERDGTDIYLAWEHEAGTSLTPASGIQGAVFFDDATEETISAHVAENAFTTKITLAGAPSGVETLYYGLGTLDYVTDFGDIIYDNSANVLPARFFQKTLPYAKYAPDQFSGLVVWFDSHISTSVSQRTDLSGNANHAVQPTAANQPTINAASQFNKDSLKFDATNDLMNIISSASLQALANEVSVEFLIAGTPTASFRSLFRTDTPTTTSGWRIQNDSNGGAGSTLSKLFVNITTSAGSQTLGTRIDGVFDGSIHHCILTINNGQVYFYKDGVKTNLGTYTHGTGFASTNNWQHENSTNLDDWLHCVYSRALTDDECAQKWEYAKARWQIT